MEDFKMLRISEVAEELGVSIPPIYRLIQSEAFPKPVKIGKRATGIPRQEIREWLRQRPRTMQSSQGSGTD